MLQGVFLLPGEGSPYLACINTRKVIKPCYRVQGLAGIRNKGLLSFDLSFILYYFMLYVCLKESNYFFGFLMVLYIVCNEVFTCVWSLCYSCFYNKIYLPPYIKGIAYRWGRCRKGQKKNPLWANSFSSPKSTCTMTEWKAARKRKRNETSNDRREKKATKKAAISKPQKENVFVHIVSYFHLASLAGSPVLHQ